MRSALLGGLCGAAVAAGVLLGAGALDDDDIAAAPPAVTQARSAAGAQTAERAADTDVGRIYEQAGPATVSVQTDRGGGTGFLVDQRGTIVTNAHVVDGSREVTIRFGPDGERLRGRVTGTDPGADLAIVEIGADDVPEDVEPLPLADSEDVGVGDLAVAIGNPFGLPRTATVGIVSAIGRTIQAPNGFSIPGAIQTDAAINPGNSGGPLLDAEGRVIGVNSQIETSGGVPGNVGIGFAVPSNTVRAVIPDLKDDGQVERGYLGVSTQDPREGEGALVAAVVPGGPAAKGGLRAGDVITAIGGDEVLGSDDVSAQVVTRRPGQKLELRVRRDGEDRTLEVTLGEQPRRAAGLQR